MHRHHITVEESKKHNQFILALDSAYYREAMVSRNGQFASMFASPINHVPHAVFCKDVQSYLVIREREYLDESLSYVIDIINDEKITSYTLSFREEKNGDFSSNFIRNAQGEPKKGDPRYKQLLPYIIARQLQDDGTYLYFPYRRTKKVGEARLAGNGSLGYGGHIDLEDVVSNKSIIDVNETILQAAFREAIEEFTLVPTAGNAKTLMGDHYRQALSYADLFIVDNSNDVGELHIGIVMHFDVPQGWTPVSAEDELKSLPAMTLAQMLASEDFNPENWTKIYLMHLKATEWNQTATEAGLIVDNADEDADGFDPEQVGIYGEDDIPGSELDEEEGSDYQIGLGVDAFAQDIINAQQVSVVSIDHGGEKVGEVDQSYFTNIAVPEYGKQASEACLKALEEVPGSLIATNMRVAVSEQDALNLGQSGHYAQAETPPDLAAIQNAAAIAYHEQAVKASSMKLAVLEAIDATQDAKATPDTPYPPFEQEEADQIAKTVTGDPNATFESVIKNG